MSEMMLATLSNIRTVDDMVTAFRDEEHCRRLLESMVWSNGRICPACGYKRSIAIAGRDVGKCRARPGLYQCCSGGCRFQFTATTHTPLHATKLPLSTWLGDMAIAAVGQRLVLRSSRRNTRGEPVCSLADRPCSASYGGARTHAGRHGRD